MRATKQHDGQITKSLSIPSAKNIPLPSSGKSNAQLPPSCPTRGALAIVANEGQGAVDAAARETNGLQRTVKSFGSDAPMQASSSKAANAARERWCHERQGHQDDLV